MKTPLDTRFAVVAALVVLGANNALSAAAPTDERLAASPGQSRPNAIVSVIAPATGNELGTIFFGDTVSDRSGPRFGGPR